MLKTVESEDVSSLVNRAINKAINEQAEYVYFELKQHFLVMRVRRGSRMRMIWRGLRTPELIAYLKAASGMDASAFRVVQKGQFAFLCQGQTIIVPAVCNPYITEERIILTLTDSLPKA